MQPLIKWFYLMRRCVVIGLFKDPVWVESDSPVRGALREGWWLSRNVNRLKTNFGLRKLIALADKIGLAV